LNFFCEDFKDLRLAAVREGSVRVGSTVDGAARVGHRLGASPGHDAEHGGDHGQHEDQAGDGDGYGEGALRDAQGIIQSL